MNKLALDNQLEINKRRKRKRKKESLEQIDMSFSLLVELIVLIELPLLYCCKNASNNQKQ
jgi:hypothetical protein